MTRLLGIGLLIFISGCVQREKNSVPTDLDGLVLKYRQAIEQEDVQAMSNILADDYIGYGPGPRGFTTKSREVRNWQHLWKNYTDFKFERISSEIRQNPDGIEKGEWIIVWGTFSFSERKDDTPSTYRYSYQSAYRMEDGKIKTRTSSLNVSDLVSQTGYRFVPPAVRGILKR